MGDTAEHLDGPPPVASPPRHGAPPSVPLAYDAALRATLEANLRGLERRAIALDGRRHAAVSVVVVDSDADADGHDPIPRSAEILSAIPGAAGFELTGSVAGTAGGPAVLLTRRSPRLRSHAGQWALPGGRLDPSETPLDAARRELEEEVGLSLREDDLLGLLDDYATRSGFVITPFVFWGGDNADVLACPEEVRSVHRIAFTELCRPDSPRFVSIPESDRPVVQIPIGGDLIHAPTGAILLQFRRVAIEGTLERVADYEQPVFAWV